MHGQHRWLLPLTCEIVPFSAQCRLEDRGARRLHSRCPPYWDGRTSRRLGDDSQNEEATACARIGMTCTAPAHGLPTEGRERERYEPWIVEITFRHPGKMFVNTNPGGRMADAPFRVLSLDGGGAKGFYTLGILREIEALIECPIHERFNMIFGTSTGAIIAAMLALGKSVPEIIETYTEYVPTVMKRKSANEKSEALAELAQVVFKDAAFEDMKTNIGIVATKWALERPMIFKANIAPAHGMKATFRPGFGVPIGDAVQASCSAYPYFNRKTVTTEKGDEIELIDGGFCANNPTLYAIADATVSLAIPPDQIRVVSLGCGTYPPKELDWWTWDHWKRKTPGVQLLQKTLEINTQSMDQLRVILYKHIPTVRISQSFAEPTMATDLFEHDLKKLNVLSQRGAQSFAENEETLKNYLL